MSDKNQFVQFGLRRLGYKSKQDLIENLYIKSIYDSYERIDKCIGIENDIRDRFIHDFYHDNRFLKKWIQSNILYVNWERWVFKNKDDLGRTDLSFALSGFEFIIECKRLRNASDKYIKDGLNRFINKEYSENESYSGMIGFVVGGDNRKICSALMEKCKLVNYCESEFVRSNSIASKTSFYTSHNREGKDAINIYHLFLEFRIERITKR
ncbi:MAG: hypothetical protein WAQ28_06645 [Bacteroidia bacterium]